MKLRLIRCICGDKSLYIDPRPPFLISSTVSISPLESSSWTPTLPSLHKHLQFQIVFVPFCLCSSIRLQENPSWRGQSSCAWLITNGAVVERLQASNSCLIRSQITNVTYSTNRIYPTSRKIGPNLHQVVSGFHVVREVLSCSPPLDSFLFITHSPKKALKIFVSTVL